LSALSIVTLALAKSFTRKTALGQGAVEIPGPPGKNAYELAVQQGFPGTLDQWLESLHAQTDIQFLTNQAIQDIFNKAIGG